MQYFGSINNMNLKIAGSASGSGSISQRYGSADPYLKFHGSATLVCILHSLLNNNFYALVLACVLFTSLVSVNSFLNTVFMAHVDSELPILDRFNLPSVLLQLACYSVLFLGYRTVPVPFLKLRNTVPVPCLILTNVKINSTVPTVHCTAMWLVGPSKLAITHRNAIVPKLHRKSSARSLCHDVNKNVNLKK